jgi:hypothetical protein
VDSAVVALHSSSLVSTDWFVVLSYAESADLVGISIVLQLTADLLLF